VVARIFHTGRQTSVGERVADALSKGNFTEVDEEMPGAVDVTHRCSQVLSQWIHDPRVDRALGWRCLQEMAVRADVLVGRDYVSDMDDMIRDKLLE
jgi:hypothetical protein